MSLPLSPLVYRAIALLLFRPSLQLHFLPNCDIFPLQFIKEHCLNDGDRVSTLFMRWRLFKLYGVITEQNTCVARVEAKECPAPAAAAAASEFGPEGGAYLAKPYSAKPESAVQESAKPYFAKPGNC